MSTYIYRFWAQKHDVCCTAIHLPMAIVQSSSQWVSGMWHVMHVAPVFGGYSATKKKNCLDHGNIWKPSIHPGSGNRRRISLTLQWPTGFRLPKGILRLVHEISWPKLRLDDNKVLITWLGGARLGVGCGWHMLTQLLKLHWQKTIFCKPCSKMFLSIHQWEFQDPNMEDPYIW